jgi:hypothetical protein
LSMRAQVNSPPRINPTNRAVFCSLISSPSRNLMLVSRALGPLGSKANGKTPVMVRYCGTQVPEQREELPPNDSGVGRTGCATVAEPSSSLDPNAESIATRNGRGMLALDRQFKSGGRQPNMPHGQGTQKPLKGAVLMAIARTGKPDGSPRAIGNREEH